MKNFKIGLIAAAAGIVSAAAFISCSKSSSSSGGGGGASCGGPVNMVTTNFSVTPSSGPGGVTGIVFNTTTGGNNVNGAVLPGASCLGGTVPDLLVNGSLDFVACGNSTTTGPTGLVSLGSVCGAGGINQVPASTFGLNAAIVAGNGYVVRAQNGNYAAVYVSQVTNPTQATSGAPTTVTIQWVYPFSTLAHGQQVYTTPGSYTWSVPKGVTAVTMQAWGGGGGGGGGYSCNFSTVSTGGGGGGGGYSTQVLAVTAGAEFQVVVGAHGTGGLGGTAASCAVVANSSGTFGQNSIVTNSAGTAVITGVGGNGGNPGQSTAGGVGGTAGSGGTTGFSGSYSTFSNPANFICYSFPGGAGGDAANGGGTGGAGGVCGGNGASAGTLPGGGGGGGAGNGAAAGGPGNSGANGEVIISW